MARRLLFVTNGSCSYSAPPLGCSRSDIGIWHCRVLRLGNLSWLADRQTYIRSCRTRMRVDGPYGSRQRSIFLHARWSSPDLWPASELDAAAFSCTTVRYDGCLFWSFCRRYLRLVAAPQTPLGLRPLSPTDCRIDIFGDCSRLAYSGQVLDSTRRISGICELAAGQIHHCALRTDNE